MNVATRLLYVISVFIMVFSAELFSAALKTESCCGVSVTQRQKAGLNLGAKSTFCCLGCIGGGVGIHAACPSEAYAAAKGVLFGCGVCCVVFCAGCAGAGAGGCGNSSGGRSGRVQDEGDCKDCKSCANKLCCGIIHDCEVLCGDEPEDNSVSVVDSVPNSASHIGYDIDRSLASAPVQPAIAGMLHAAPRQISMSVMPDVAKRHNYMPGAPIVVCSVAKKRSQGRPRGYREDLPGEVIFLHESSRRVPQRYSQRKQIVMYKVSSNVSSAGSEVPGQFQ